MGLTYLSAPYTHDDPRIVKRRMDAVSIVSIYLDVQGHNTVSPLFKDLVVQRIKSLQGNHPHLEGRLALPPLSYDFWREYCKQMLMACSSMIVVPLDGYLHSTGVQDETALCIEHNIPYTILDEDVLAQLLSGINPRSRNGLQKSPSA